MAEEQPVDAAAALSAALDAEYAAVHGYGFARAHLSDEARDRAADHEAAHRAQRDRLRRELRDADAEVPAALTDYPVSEDTAESAIAEFAAALERRCCEAYLELCAAPGEALREMAVHALAEAAVRLVDWDADLPTYPGMPGDSPP